MISPASETGNLSPCYSFWPEAFSEWYDGFLFQRNHTFLAIKAPWICRVVTIYSCYCGWFRNLGSRRWYGDQNSLIQEDTPWEGGTFQLEANMGNVGPWGTFFKPWFSESASLVGGISMNQAVLYIICKVIFFAFSRYSNTQTHLWSQCTSPTLLASCSGSSCTSSASIILSTYLDIISTSTLLFS